jgi:Leucine-rich repeat (LRR) protein
VLVLAKTEITEFGESIGNLKNLQGLYAKETKITRLPRSFKELTALEELDLKNTSISNEYAEEIAHCLYSMPNLKIFRYSICSPGGLDEELPGRYNTFTDPEEYIYG